MDIICPRCCEPWEIDTVHEYVGEMREMFPRGTYSFGSVYRAFITKGCGQAFHGWKVTCEPVISGPGLSFYSLGEMFGDDVDGYASFCEDFGGVS